jgi:large subunit ribosomal protein L15
MSMTRAARKIRKQRGSRSCGGGSHKKRRGAGHRGGKGMAGTHKSKWTWVIKYDPEHFGRRGFKTPKAVKKSIRTINVGELEKLAQIQRGNKSTLDLSGKYDKVLGKGKVSIPLVVRADSFTEKAVKKIESAGGKAVSLSNSEVE